MKTMNNFQISGFVVNNATVNQFATASVARFGISVRRTEKVGEEEKKVSAILNIEAWKSNEAADSFDLLKKGTRLSVEGYFKPEEWTDKDNVNHNTIKLVATKFFEMKSEDKSDETPAEKPNTEAE
jgi:single-strand DNA-binding protein